MAEATGNSTVAEATGDSAEAAGFAVAFDALVTNVEKVLRGKHEAVTLAWICMLAEGHLLIEDVPGVGKTSLARALAASVGLSCQRVQFTPDLLPADITGVTVYSQQTGEFEFHEGPVFANVVIGDEVNRASPKTQSALLEVMEERQVTVDGRARPVPLPFLVVATQNPIDMSGTYALPEAQLDRFLMRVALGYPGYDAEVQVLFDRNDGRSTAQLAPVVSKEEFFSLVEVARRVHVSQALAGYVVRLVAATRTSRDVVLGASPRGSIALLRAAQVRAVAHGRDFVVPDDVKALAVAVLAHRLILSPEAELRGTTSRDLVDAALDDVAVPRRPDETTRDETTKGIEVPTTVPRRGDGRGPGGDTLVGV